ncbi:alpha/beta hydrolase fold domain-containing protein [Mucilaginibacter sp. AW1-3]
MKLTIIALLLTTGLLAAQAQDTAKVKKEVAIPAGFTKQLDVVYTQANGWDGKADLYLPPNTGKPTPVIINIHGGGWNHGSKDDQGGFNIFFKLGYAVANMEYRLMQQAKAPGCVEDTRCMLIYLIKNAKTLNIDPNKIVIMGGSAGAHLALMGGLLANDHRFDTNCPGVDNVKVVAIIDKYGIADVWDWGNGVIKSKSVANWLGGNNTAEFAKSVSPIFYVNKNSPPTFIAHGNADTTVPYQQSVDLHKKFLEMGVKTEFMTVEGGGHGKWTKEQNDEVNKGILKFLKEVGI